MLDVRMPPRFRDVRFTEFALKFWFPTNSSKVAGELPRAAPRMPWFGVPNSWFFFAKYSAEKTKCIDVSQPANQGDERN